MKNFVIIVSIFINIGIVYHIFKYLPKLGLSFLLSFRTEERKLKLTFNGKPLFPEEKYQQPRSEDPLYIVVLIPAWNEQDSVSKSIKSILNQTRVADRVFVVPNNTTDLTSVVAMASGAEVLVMPGRNEKKKAGALNYAMDMLSPLLDQYNHTAVMVMDADTTVEQNFLEKAEQKLLKNKYVGGVSSIFVGKNSHNLLGILQQMEFARFRLLVKKRLEVYVLSGTASLISWDALKEVKKARNKGEVLPKGESYYDVDSMTEDNELTLAILSLGYTIPHVGVESITDVMDDFNSLYYQRKRWYLGALQNIKMYGKKMQNWMRFIYWFQQVGLYLSLAVTPILLFAFTYWLTEIEIAENVTNTFEMTISYALLFFYLLTQVITVWSLGWKARIVALLYFPEIVYGIFLLIFHAGALKIFLNGKNMNWKHT